MFIIMLIYDCLGISVMPVLKNLTNPRLFIRVNHHLIFLHLIFLHHHLFRS